MHKPLVSVLMTCFNREDMMSDSINSVLNSNFHDFELIIVDDCSNDNSFQKAKDFSKLDARIRVYKNDKNLGDYPNRNKAAGYATGEYIKYLDSDDVMYPHCLEVMVKSMLAFPHAGFGVSSISNIDEPFPICIKPHQIYKEHFNGFNHFDRAPGSVIIKKVAFDSVGGFSGKRMIGDFELWFKMANQFDMVKFPRDLVWDRVHEGQEKSSTYAKQYSKLRKAVLVNALSKSNCPLNDTEKRKILKDQIKNELKLKIQKWI